MKKEKSITIYTAVKLSNSELKNIADYLKDKHDIEGEISQEVDKNLIAGFKISYLDLVIDFSVAGKLDRLSGELTS